MALRPSADRAQQIIDQARREENMRPGLRPTADQVQRAYDQAADRAMDEYFQGNIESYYGGGPSTAVTPQYSEFDFSSGAAQQRAFATVVPSADQEYYDRIYRYNPPSSVTPAEFASPRTLAARNRLRRRRALELLSSSSPQTLDMFPTLRRVIADIPDLNEEDVRNLINLTEMETAFQRMMTADQTSAQEIWMSMDPVMQAGFTDYFEDRFAQMIEEAQKDPSWFQQGFEWFTNTILFPSFNALMFLNEGWQQVTRAQAAAIQDNNWNAAAYISPVVGLAVNGWQYWDSVAPGARDEERLKILRVEHGAVVDVFLDLEEKQRDGQGNAYARWIDEWADTEYSDVVRDVTYRPNENADLIEIANKVSMTNRDKIGSLVWGNLPEDWLGSQGVQTLSGVTNFGFTVFNDPTIFGAKVFTTARASRYALTKLAGPGGADEVFKYRRTRNIFNALGRDLGRLERIEDPAKRALARQKIDEAYGGQLPADVIDDMARFNSDRRRTDPDLGDSRGIRNADDAYEYFKAAERMTEIVEGGPRFTQNELFARLMTVQEAKRVPLAPGKSMLGVLRTDARRAAAFLNPAVRGQVAKEAKLLPEDPDELATVLMGEEYAAAVGIEPRLQSELLQGSEVFGYRYSSRGVSSRLDRLFRNWAKAPFNMTIDLMTGKDAGKVYQWARAFLPRYHASAISDAFRNGTPGTRKRILDGLQNTSARARGVQFRSPDNDMLRFSSESRKGRTYSPDITVVRGSDGVARVVDKSDRTNFGLAIEFASNNETIPVAAIVNDIGDARASVDDVVVYGNSINIGDDLVGTIGVDAPYSPNLIENWARTNNYSVVRYTTPDGERIVVLPEMIQYGGNDPVQKAIQLADQYAATGQQMDDVARAVINDEVIPGPVLAEATETTSMSSFPNPNIPGEEIQLPIHLWQARSAVTLPNFNEIYEAGVNASVFGATLGWTHHWVAQRLVDLWSLLNLAGPRYYLRNATEDYIMYAMTSGRFASVQKGRRMSTALRESRGGKLRGANRVRSRKRQIDMDNVDVDHASRWSAIKASFSEEDIAAAQLALENGDVEAIRRIAAIAIGRMKFKGMSGVETDYFLDFITLHGEKMIDEVAGTTMYGSSAGAPIAAEAAETALDAGGKARIIYPSKEFDSVSLAGNDPFRFWYWHRNLLGAADRDGVVGKLTIANLDKSDDEIVPLIVRALEEDEVTKRYGYKEKLASLNHPDETYETFARRYIADVRNLLSGKDGQLNRALWNKLVTTDENGDRVVRMAIRDSGETKFAIEVADLMQVPDGLRPANVLGKKTNDVPTATSVNFFDKWWQVMGDQYAVFAREPIFFANYIDARKMLAPLEARWTEEFGETYARQRLAKIATDRAYLNTLAYTDNPLNRTMLAWNSRNIARYYRATEDFARRMLRVGKNYPQGFWKVALTYDALDETGFVWTDNNNQKFFVFPGSDALIKVMGSALEALPGNLKLLQFDDADMELRGIVTMIAPSTDPKQSIPSLSSPLAALPVKALMALFPSLRTFEQALLGEYSEGQEWWKSVLPGHVLRLMQTVNPDERQGIYASTIKDAIAISAAAGNLPAADSSDEVNKKYIAELQTLATTVLITRLVTGVVFNTTPRVGFNDVTKFARDRGYIDMDSGLKQLINLKAEEGSINPVGDALTEYVQTFGPNAIPYSLSKYDTGNPWNTYSGRLSPPATEQARIWAIENNDLITNDKYQSGAVWLMPRGGDFNGDMWRYLINLGMKTPSTIQEFFQDAQSTTGKWMYYRVKEAHDDRVQKAEIQRYQAILAGDEQRVEELDNLLKAYDIDWNGDPDNAMSIGGKAKLEAEFPDLNFSAFELAKNARYLTLRNEVLPMLNYVLNERGGEPPAVAVNMMQAINTFNKYIVEVDSVEGQTRAENERKFMLRTELISILTDIGSRDENTQFFVDSILIPLVKKPEDYVELSREEGLL